MYTHFKGPNLLYLKTFAQGVVNMEPAHTILTPAELEEARGLLQTKPPTISQDEFDVIKGQIFDGVPMVEYILVRDHSTPL